MDEIRKYAVLDNNTVVEVLDLNEAGYIYERSYHQMLVDVQDLVITPEIGWVLSGNKLVPGPGMALTLELAVKSKIKYFQDNASELMRNLYVQNTLLGITTQQSDQMFDDYQDVLVRIREGAWPTALYRLSQKQPSGFVTQEMITNWYNTIYAKMMV